MKKFQSISLKKNLLDEKLNIWILIAFLSFIDVIYRIGPISLRMATSVIDDNPILASQVMKNPDLFSFDIYAQIITDTQKNSLLTWITYFLKNAFGIDYFWIWLAITILQRILLYTSVALIASQLSQRKYFKHFALIGIAASNPYFWNLGWFGSLDNQPYAMWSAIPFMLFAYYFVNFSRHKEGYLAWLVGFLIHPSLALLVSSILVITYTKNNHKTKRILTLKLFLISIFPIAYIMSTNIIMPEQAKFSVDLKKIAFTNPHLNFFNPFSSTYPLLSLRIWVILISLSVTVLIFLKKSNDIRNLNLQIWSIGISLIFIALHAIFMKLQCMPGILLFGPRLTVFLAIILYVFFLKYLYELINSNTRIEKIEGVIIFLFPSVAILAISAFNSILKSKKIERRILLIRAGHCLMLLLILIPLLQKLIFLSPSKWENFSPLQKIFDSYLNIQNTGFISYFVSGFATLISRDLKINFILLTIFVIFILYTAIKSRNDLRVISLLLLSVIILTNGLRYQSQWSYDGVAVSQVHDFADMQLWAKNNTLENSNFYLEGASSFTSWRTLSQRPRVNPNINWSMYNYPDYAFQHNQKLQNWWNEQIADKKLLFYGQWNDKFICNSYPLFHTNYVLQSYKQESMDFPLVYKNESFKMYRVVCK